MNNKTIFERQAEPDYEWRDGDDQALYDEGYQDGVIKAIEIINSIRNVENVDRVPFHITMSAVVATLSKVANGEYQ